MKSPIAMYIYIARYVCVSCNEIFDTIFYEYNLLQILHEMIIF